MSEIISSVVSSEDTVNPSVVARDFASVRASSSVEEVLFVPELIPFIYSEKKSA